MVRMEHDSEEDKSSGRDGSASLVGASLETGGFGHDREVVAAGWDDRGRPRVSCAKS